MGPAKRIGTHPGAQFFFQLIFPHARGAQRDPAALLLHAHADILKDGEHG
jgi:hypothetical protein